MCSTNDGRIRSTFCCSTLPLKYEGESFRFITTTSIYDPSNEFLMQILLYGDKDIRLNKDILLLKIRFIHETGRFDKKFRSQL